jgi:glyoxylase-like metal-dependent hydrolase (beta-lactamase superfamily II)
MLSITGTAVAQQRDFSNVEIKTHKVTDSIYMLEGAGGNIGVSAGADGVILIDDQFAPLTDKIVAAIKAISDKEIRFLINTHIHPDHVGGNENLGKQGVQIIAHDNIRSRLAAGVNNNPPLPDVALPVVTFNDTVTFHMNGEPVKAFKVANAHTDGDTVIHFTDSNVIHTGDVFRTTTYPFIDAANGGSFSGLLDVLQQLYDMSNPETVIIPGHGVITDREMVKEFLTMLVTVRDRIKEQIDQGKTVEDVVAANVTAEYDERWAPQPGGFFSKEAFIALVFNELKGNP